MVGKQVQSSNEWKRLEEKHKELEQTEKIIEGDWLGREKIG